MKIPACLWFDGPLDEVPGPPSEEIELEADRFEMERLKRMAGTKTGYKGGRAHFEEP